MKRIIVFVAATAILAFAAAGPAGASSARSTKSPTLAQFNALSKKVTALQKQVKTLSTDVNLLAAYDVCLTAATADALQGTWIFVNKGASVSVYSALRREKPSAVSSSGSAAASRWRVGKA